MTTSRRRFLASAGAFAVGGALSASAARASSATGYWVAQASSPETTQVRLGFIPIVESAPLIIAKEKGFFAKHGLTQAEVLKQASWPAARDNLVIGSAGGGIDGGQWQMPMPYWIHTGAITNNNPVPMAILCQLNTQGNGIAIAGQHADKGLGLNVAQAADYIKNFPTTNGRKFKAAYTFPGANQDFWIRYWFAAGGIDPDQDIDLLAVPPAETVQGMRNGTMDAFSTGDPWPFRIVSDQIGFMAALTQQMWPFHPEEYLAMRADWVEKHPRATRALLMAVMEAQQWCDNPANRPELIQICSSRTYFNVPANVLTPPFEGRYILGDGKPDVNDFKAGPLYWQDGRGSISYPYKSHDLWFLTEAMRWGYHKAILTDLDRAKKLIEEVNREDLWRDAAKALGVANIPNATSRGPETFFDGVTFDAADPQAYLNRLAIKRV
ncbi:MAG: CmpA/NrtA family ABC transporter substrate-binding protein [Thermostichales cyanobacterium BF4_bins_65]